MAELLDAVTAAVSWARDGEGQSAALAELAIALAKEIEADRSFLEHPPPVAPVAKELRATLGDLEGLRDGNDADASLGTLLSSPVWDAAQSGPGHARAARRKDQRKSG